MGLPPGKPAARVWGFSPAGAAGSGGSRATAGRGVLPRGKPANAGWWLVEVVRGWWCLPTCRLFDLSGSRRVGGTGRRGASGRV